MKAVIQRLQSVKRLLAGMHIAGQTPHGVADTQEADEE